MASKILVEWQGLLQNLEKTLSHKFHKIKQLAGHEEKLDIIVKSVKQSQTFQQYLTKDENKQQCSEDIKNILKLFIANTKFQSKSLLQETEYSHLINTTPIISRCILVNIIVQLDLHEIFSLLFLNLPVQIFAEILVQLKLQLKYYLPDSSYKPTFLYLKQIIGMVKYFNEQDSLLISTLRTSFEGLLENMYFKESQESLHYKKQMKIDQDNGFTLLYLYYLIQECSLQNDNHVYFLKLLVRACEEILQKVTGNMFINWLEVEAGDFSLQVTITIEATNVKNLIENFEDGQELIKYMGPCSSKENIIKSTIKTADIETVVDNIDKANKYQQEWFNALIYHEDLFSNADAIDCLSKWMKLCTYDTVSILIVHLNEKHNDYIKNVLINCIKILNIADLKLLIQNYYESHNMDVAFINSLNTNLNALLNKLTNNDENEMDLIKEIYAIFLLNPKHTLHTLYNRCLQSSAYVDRFLIIFKFLKSVPKVPKYFKYLLKISLLNVILSSSKQVNYTNLIKFLLNLKYFSKCELLNDVLIPYVIELNENNKHDNLLYLLQLSKEICENFDEDVPLSLIEILVKIIDCSRTSCLNFSYNKQYCVEMAVALLLKLNVKLDVTCRLAFKDKYLNVPCQNKLTQYYCNLIEGKIEKSFLETYCDSYDVTDLPRMISLLLIMLSQSVQDEWTIIINELQSNLNNEVVLNMLLLVFQIFSEYATALSNYAMEWFSNQYLVIIKDMYNTKENAYKLSQHIINLLEFLDNDFHSLVLPLINLIPKEHFKSLKVEKSIIFALLAYKDPTLADIITKKMLAED